MAKETKDATTAVQIKPPNIRRITVTLEGLTPLMQARWTAKAITQMREKQAQGSQAKKGKKREARDFDADFRDSQHVSTEGWNGVPAAAIRNSCIDACRLAGYAMTQAKMSIFVDAHGIDAVDGTPLVKLIADKPEKNESMVRNATGVADIRVRPMWRKWQLKPVIAFDGDQFSQEDVVNLLSRAGLQVGIGEGRPFSKKSNGLGLGTFKVV
jgi:hypothetical protein